MSEPRISFVIPAYNAADTITESIDSIFNGNYIPGDEVIIVNDCSTDETTTVIEKLRQKYTDKLLMIDNAQNKGCPASRNVGIRAATNELIFNLDADNILAPGSIAKLKSGLVENQADLATFANYHYFIEDRSRITHYWHCNPGWFTTADLFAGHINPAPGGNFLYTKASWERIGGYWEYGKGLHEAWGFTFKQLVNGSKIFVVPETHYLHRHGHESLFATESKVNQAETTVLQQIISPYEHLFEPDDFAYIQSHPEWFSALDKRPIILQGETLGKNGRLQKTPYGIMLALIKKLKQIL